MKNLQSDMNEDKDAQRDDDDLYDELLLRRDEHEELINKLSELNALKESGEYEDIDEHIVNAERTYAECEQRIDTLSELLEDRGICIDDVFRRNTTDCVMEPRVIQAVQSEMASRLSKPHEYDPISDADSNQVDVLEESNPKDVEEMKMIEAEEKKVE